MARPTHVYELYTYNTYQMTGTANEVSAFTGFHFDTVHRLPRLRKGETLDPEVGKHHLVLVDTIKAEAPIYALYKGEELIADGTLREIAEKVGKTPESVRWYNTPSAKKRNLSTVLVKLEEDEG